MTEKQITGKLEGIVSSNDFAGESAELADDWISLGVGIDAIKPILRFMEKYPSLDYGMPGALVHFAERFYGKGYEQMLLESLQRRPTITTIWMLNRVINGTKASDQKAALRRILEDLRHHRFAAPDIQQFINDMLEE